MEWISSDFDRMRFNAFKNRKRKMMDLYEEFQDYPEFSLDISGLKREKVLRYICFVYDKGTPLPGKINELLKIKYEAALLAGFKPSNAGMFDHNTELMIIGKNKAVNHMIVRFLSFFHDNAYMTLQLYKDKHYFLSAVFKETTDEKKLETTLKLINTLNNDMAKLEAAVHYPEESADIVEAMYELINFKELELTPEKIAERLESGLSPVDNPAYENWTKENYSEKDLEEGEE